MEMIAKTFIHFCLSSAVTILLVQLAHSEPSTGKTPAPSSPIEKSRAILKREIVPKVPGLSVAVAVKGSLVWSESFGYADLEKGVHVTAKTRFRIGSISKPLTAAALALLVERGQLDLDAPIQKYLPDFPLKSDPITIRQLGGHLSGIRDYRKGEPFSNIAYTDSRSRLKIFEDDPLEALPGKRFKYSSFNWNVIGAVIEQVAGEKFVPFMDANVLKPLSLSDTCAEFPDALDVQRPQFYEVDKTGALIAAPRIDIRFSWASAGYLSTAEDLARFGSAVLHPGFLKATSVETLFTEQRTSDGELTGYGLGWFVYCNPHVIYHSGETAGGLSILLMLPETGTVVAILTNRGGLNVPVDNHLYFNIEEIGFRVARLFSPEP